MMKRIPYWRLPGSSGLFFRKALYMGPDHVLCVNSNVASQEYRRFYFSDIQAFLITDIESPARFYGFLFAALAGAVTMLLAGRQFREPYPVDLRMFWAVICGLTCIGLVVFALTRPKVHCSLKTRAGTQSLPSLKSKEWALQVANIIRTEVDKAQGTFTAELTTEQPIEAAVILPQSRYYSGWIHYVAFGLMLMSAALAFSHSEFSFSAAYNQFIAGLHMAVVVFACGAAVNQHDNGVNQTARICIMLALAWTFLSFVATVIVSVGLGIALQTRAVAEYWSDPIRGIAQANAIANAVLGLLGLISMPISKVSSRRR